MDLKLRKLIYRYNIELMGDDICYTALIDDTDLMSALKDWAIICSKF